MKYCPNFECLDFSMSICEKYPACTGCSKLNDCTVCSNQAVLISGRSLPCDMISLPEQCRVCPKRSADDFAPEADCLTCAVTLSAEKSP